MADRIDKFLDVLRWGWVRGVLTDPLQDFQGVVLWTQAEEVVELAQVGQFALHLLIFPLHGL